MGAIWSEAAKYQAWLRVEVAVCEAYARRGRIPAEALGRIRDTRVDIERILAIQHRVKHEMIALLTSLEEQLGPDSRFVHIGLTTNDVWDTATALQLRDAADLLIAGQERLRAALATLARRHRDTLTVARTHGVHAEPTTFGLKVAVWYVEAGRNLERLRRAREAISVGKLSGAVGNFAHVAPEIEEEVCRDLDLGVEPVSTQIVQRDRHAEFVSALAIAGASLEKIALEVRGLQRTEVLEAQEPFGEGQKGSSAMPHKRNPELAERICGLARLLRTNALAAVENVADRLFIVVVDHAAHRIEFMLLQYVHGSQRACALVAMRRVDHDRKSEFLRQLDLRPQRLVFEGCLFVVAQLSHRDDAFLDEKTRQGLNHRFGQSLVVGFLRVQADGAIVPNAELPGAEALEAGYHGKVVDIAADICAGLSKPEGRLDHRDHAGLGHCFIVVGRPRDHVGVGINDHPRISASAVRSLARLIARSRRQTLHVAQQAGEFLGRQRAVAAGTCERLAGH
jgi:adenylosuccinate lyase